MKTFEQKTISFIKNMSKSQVKKKILKLSYIHCEDNFDSQVNQLKNKHENVKKDVFFKRSVALIYFVMYCCHQKVGGKVDTIR